MKPTKSNHFNKTFSKNKFIFSETIFSMLIFLVMLLIISNPSKYSKGTIEGINLFITAVMPGLFPFMLLTKLLIELGFVFKITKKCDKFSQKLFGTPGISLFAFFMSILSGYPIGAKIISELFQKGLISESDAKKMSIFCTTSGPIFVIGAVGTSLFGEYKIGVILYLSHILSSIILGIGFNLFSKKNPNESTNRPQMQIEIIKKDNIFASCVVETINSIFVVGAYITIFYLIGEILDTFKIMQAISEFLFLITKPFKATFLECQSFTYGLLEVTRACKSFALCKTNLSIALCCGVISFSGFSIIMQSMAFLKTAKIKMHSFIFAKLVHMIVSIFICFLMLVTFL